MKKYNQQSKEFKRYAKGVSKNLKTMMPDLSQAKLKQLVSEICGKAIEQCEYDLMVKFEKSQKAFRETFTAPAPLSVH